MFLARPRACTLHCLRSAVCTLVSYKLQSAAKSLRNARRVITRVCHEVVGNPDNVSASLSQVSRARRTFQPHDRMFQREFFRFFLHV